MDSIVDDSRRLDTCPYCERQFKNVKLHQTKAKCSGPRQNSVNKSFASIPAGLPRAGGERIPDSFSLGSKKGLRHKLNTRVIEDLPDVELRSRLKLPGAGDASGWSQLDLELSKKLEPVIQHLPSVIGKGEMFEEIIYEHVAEKHGTIDVTVKSKLPCKKKNHQKKEIKRLKKLLKKQVKSGLASDKKRKEYHMAVRLHNKIVKLERREKNEKLRNEAMRDFRKNPFKYAQNLLNESKKKKKLSPNLSQNRTENYFRSTYYNRKRHHNYHSIKGLPRTARPKDSFDLKFPSLKEVKELIRKKPKKASPGPSGVPYLIYKKCPKVTALLYQLLNEIWSNKKNTVELEAGGNYFDIRM